MAKVSESIPMRRYGRPAEVAAVIAFCARPPQATSPAKPST
jgi:NAD(P)-dependent dehydrogenase (short-subunit alcohol dehydrogenase family)